ncbi:hypothetical protein CRM22_007263 [Opisthorchis felineus]|uniref:LITAF domain-containing protein n=1 Tax=Opisthorchis felineus TaxID=147828 RepID=A0A4S2LPX6_OPIFE|nr:hypothetical protein CRM22_007263 [Opisthorchis felineus]
MKGSIRAQTVEEDPPPYCDQVPSVDIPPGPSVIGCVGTISTVPPPYICEPETPRDLTTPDTCILQLSSIPTAVFCRHCFTEVVTKVKYQSGSLTWVMCATIACFCGILGCCLIPFFMKRYKNVLHICPQCGVALGTYKRI